jgi:GNAT superfamily N-acetyltransferase
MGIELRRLTAAEFCARVVPALLDREAENGLPIGIARRVAASSEPTTDVLFLAVEEDGAVVGATVWGPPHEVVITRVPPGAVELVAAYCVGSGWRVGGATGPDAIGLELAEALAHRTRTTVRTRQRQRVYELTAVADVVRAAGAMRPAGPADRALVADWYEAFAEEVHLAHPMAAIDWAAATIASGSAFLWDDGEVRSLACLSRETPNGRAIGPVYTPPAGRGHGYATSLVADLTRQVLASGKRFACLFTDDVNATSNHIYEAIGFRVVCRFDAYALVPPAEA